MRVTPFNENSRVKIPALVHLTRLGYTYISVKDTPAADFDYKSNIYLPSFIKAVNRLNNDAAVSDAAIIGLTSTIDQALDSDDLGRTFYGFLQKDLDGLTLIDFEHPENNIYECMTELTCGCNEDGTPADDNFRPDITLFINGLPLVFIEVKKPNNKEGIIAEQNRMTVRNQNKKFRRFINMTQLMIFSNNQEYDDTEVAPVTGAFYATANYGKPFFSRFREPEENSELFDAIEPIDPEKENFILRDTNLVSIAGTDEYNTNKNNRSPTHRILTSMVSRRRLLFLLKYGFAYVERKLTKKDEHGIEIETGVTTLEKNVMRYPQFFATKAIEQTLNKGIKKGIIWHTQGSGKTALAYHNVYFLTNYYQQKGIIAKFYFIVDRLDLLKQAAGEFRARGLSVIEVNSRDAFIKNIQNTADQTPDGLKTITVVNIQKFSIDSVSLPSKYNIKIQRVYFLDEAHRSYDPSGSFLANLIASDRDAVKIALTGTPIIGEHDEYDIDDKKLRSVKFNSTAIFGDYIHRYFYNWSIKDGYTLRLIREGIKTEYREKIKAVLDNLNEIEVLKKGDRKAKEAVYANAAYVEAMVSYITDDFKSSRIRMNDESIGGMIVCDSSKQARAVFEELKKEKYSDLKSQLILCDEDDKETRENYRDAFKSGEIDLLIVFNMLLTGFDAPRLKKMYVGRLIRSHNLLQALTRVNRPYRDFHYGYVVDFADIRDEFDKTNKAYFSELQKELGDDYSKYDTILMSKEEIDKRIEEVRNILFNYNTDNIEEFCNQINAVPEKKQLLEVKNALQSLKELDNAIRMYNYSDLADRFDGEKVKRLYSEVTRRIDTMNTLEHLQNSDDTQQLLNEALAHIEFKFKKISQDELVIADSFLEQKQKTAHEFSMSQDIKDPEYITLLDKLRAILNKKNIEEMTSQEMIDAQKELAGLQKQIAAKNAADRALCAKYRMDAKFMRVHKRLRETPPPIANDIVLNKVLLSIKEETDNTVLNNVNIIQNENYFTGALNPIIVRVCRNNNIPLNLDKVKLIDQLVSTEYIHEYAGIAG